MIKLLLYLILLVALDLYLFTVNWPVAIIAAVIWLLIGIVRLPAWLAEWSSTKGICDRERRPN